MPPSRCKRNRLAAQRCLLPVAWFFCTTTPGPRVLYPKRRRIYAFLCWKRIHTGHISSRKLFGNVGFSSLRSSSSVSRSLGFCCITPYESNASDSWHVQRSITELARSSSSAQASTRYVPNCSRSFQMQNFGRSTTPLRSVTKCAPVPISESNECISSHWI